MKNSIIGEEVQGTEIPKTEGKKIKKSKSIDKVNMEKIKVNLKKGSKIPLDKTKVNASKSLYKGTDGLNGEQQKKFRSKIRRGLHSFVNQILGKDRPDAERKESIKKFITFYKLNWKVQDFKIESFSQSKDQDDLKDYKNLLGKVQESLKK